MNADHRNEDISWPPALRFSDPLTECDACHQSFRADHLIEALGIEGVGALKTDQLDELIEKHNIVCPECGCKLGKSFEFNLMFQTKIGPGVGRQGYLRPETAQGIFVDFSRISRFYREKLPFGAVQIGKSYRNEISPRQGVLRLREFTQAECEIFVDPDVKTHPNFEKYKDVKLKLYPQAQQTDEAGTLVEKTVGEAVLDGTIAHEFLGYYVALTNDFLTRVGISPSDLRFRQHLCDEMAHYAMDCWDAEVKTDRFGWVEVVGIADRTNYDLTAHAKQSKVELSVYVEYPEPIFETKFVIKPAMGKLGPLFKGKAKAVGDALKELGAEEIQSAGEEISVTVDGEILSVPKNLIAFGEEKVKISGKTVVPHVIEPSYGIDRITYCVMEHAFVEEDLTVAAAADDSENDGNGGNDGNRGRDGSDGNNESDGRDGNSGSDGRDGSDGNSGSDGRDGSNGNSGSDGRDGNDEKEDSRVIMKFKNAVAPYQVAVHPLMGKAELSNAAKKLFNEIVSAGIMVDYDESGTIGKRYRRNDEIGIPYSVTIDYDTIEKETNPITIRDRDTMKQILVPAANLVFVLENLISGKKTFEESGEILSR